MVSDLFNAVSGETKRQGDGEDLDEFSVHAGEIAADYFRYRLFRFLIFLLFVLCRIVLRLLLQDNASTWSAGGDGATSVIVNFCISRIELGLFRKLDLLHYCP